MNVRRNVALLVFAALVGGCTHASQTAPATAFQLASNTFAAEAMLPDSTVLNGLDCNGPNESPELHWSGAPAGTRSYALILDDYEARYADGFIHWATSPRRRRSSPPTPARRSRTSPAAGRTPRTTSSAAATTDPARRKARPTVTASRFTRSISPRSTTPARR